jgi:hypothetical protein
MAGRAQRRDCLNRYGGTTGKVHPTGFAGPGKTPNENGEPSMNGFKTLSNAEKLTEIGKRNFRRDEIALRELPD